MKIERTPHKKTSTCEINSLVGCVFVLHVFVLLCWCIPSMSKRGRGRGKGAAGAPVGPGIARDSSPGASSNPKDAVAEQGDGKEDTHSDKCGMCKLVVGDEGIGCDRCTSWFHPSEMCMGLSKNSIHVIVESEDSDALLYLCTACRLNPGTGTWTKSKERRPKTEDGQIQVIMQLFQTVKGLCSEVANLSEKINAVVDQKQGMDANSAQPPHDRMYSEVTRRTPAQTQIPAPSMGPQLTQPPATLNENQYRSVASQEVREIQEREKRRSSLVIKGLASTSPAGVVTEFSDIAATMMGTRVTLTNVVRIPNNPGLWRAKLLDDDH